VYLDHLTYCHIYLFTTLRSGDRMKIAIYARVSTEEQNLDHQIQPMVNKCKSEGWEYSIFAEKTSGAKSSRTELDCMMRCLRNRQYNAVMVYKLDRLGRSLKHLIQLIEEFNNRNIQFMCLSPELDTKTANGRFFINIIGAVAELERELIRERTKARLDYLKKQGKHIGRPAGSKDKKSRRKSGYYLRYAGNK
jgi:DNA invertase Pin-like site-specific DNA recombinase